MAETVKLGTLPDETAQRDAIHVAVAPVIAAEKLFPGSDVGLNDDGEATVKVPDWIGIVDPFVKAPIQQGQRFYVVLYPGTVTSLRHEWEHPAFKEAVAVPAIEDEYDPEYGCSDC